MTDANNVSTQSHSNNTSYLSTVTQTNTIKRAVTAVLPSEDMVLTDMSQPYYSNFIDAKGGMDVSTKSGEHDSPIESEVSKHELSTFLDESSYMLNQTKSWSRMLRASDVSSVPGDSIRRFA